MNQALTIEDSLLLSRERAAAIDQPVEAAVALPNYVYTSATFAARERDTLLADTWLCIGFGSDVPAAGDLQPIQYLELPLVMVRSPGGAVNVFHNVCSHRGQLLVQDKCTARGVIRCPYHSWTYSFNGELKGTPHFGGPGVHQCEGFDRARHGLRKVRSALWHDLVFINLSGTAPEFEDYLQPLMSRWAPYWGPQAGAGLEPDLETGRTQLTVQANWKLAVENYCESYHLPWVHPGLNSYSRLEDHYNIVEPGHFAGQGTQVYNPVYCEGASLPRFPDWPEERQSQAEYAALFPNVLLGLQVDHFFAVVLQPTAHDCTVEHLQLYYLGGAARDAQTWEARRRTRDAWQQVFSEDVWAVEGMQRGRRSPAFDGGVFSPAMDPATHCFHRWVAQRIVA